MHVIQVIFSKPDHRYKLGTRLQGNLYKTLAL